MKIIFDKNTGRLYATLLTEDNIEPICLDVEVPKGQIFKEIVIENGEPKIIFSKIVTEETEENLRELIDELKNEFSKKLETTNTAIAELSTNLLTDITE